MAVSKGIQTTEFALVCVTKAATFVAMVVGVIPPAFGLLICAGIVSVYGILRAIVKNGDPSYVAPALPTEITNKGA